MTPPKISVIVNLYNSARYLSGCTASLKRQSFSDFEALLVDGGSSDATPDIAQALQREDPRFRFLPSTAFKPIAQARAEALAACRGGYVAVLDSDDKALPRRLEKQAQWLDRHPDTALLSTYYRVVNNRGWPLRWTGVSFTHDIDMRWRLTFGNCLTQSTIMFRKETALKAGGYDPAVRAGEDMDFYSRMMGQGTLDILPEVLNVWRWHPKSLSRTEPLAHKEDFIRTVQNAVFFQLGKKISAALAAAVFNQSALPAESRDIFREALDLTRYACDHFYSRLYQPSAEKPLLGRAAFIQLVDLFTKNRDQPWWPEVDEDWKKTVRALSAEPLRYRGWADAGLLRYYRKFLKSDWRFIPALGKF